MITLEISGTDVRLLEATKGRVTRWASRSLEPGMFQEGVIVNPQALGAAIKQLMTSSGIKGRNVVASVSGLYSLSRIITISGPAEPTREAVLEAAAEVMPLSEEELYLSWQTIASVDGGQQVLVVGVPRDVLDSEAQAFKAASIQPRLLDLKPMALARAVNEEQALILNVQPSSFDIVIVVNGVLEVIRTVAWQVDELTGEEKVDHLATALERAVGFYALHHPGFPLDRTTPLFVTGQMSEDFALMENLRARVEYPFESWTPPLLYPEHLPLAQYAVNIGLALKGTAATKGAVRITSRLPDINLLPDVYRAWKPTARQIYFFSGIVLAVVLLLPFYQVTTNAVRETSGLKAKYAGVNSLLGRRQAEIRSREPLQQGINEYKTILDMGGGFTEDIKVINSLAQQLGVEVQSITHSGGSLSVECQAESSTVFRNYVTALRESGRFSSVSAPPFRFVDVRGGTLGLTR